MSDPIKGFYAPQSEGDNGPMMTREESKAAAKKAHEFMQRVEAEEAAARAEESKGDGGVRSRG